MRRRRIEAKTRVAAKAFLAGTAGAVETCLALSHGVSRYPILLSEDDRKLISVVARQTNALPVGKLRDNWHPQFLPAKLEQLAKYEATIEEDVKGLCDRLLETMKTRAVKAKA